MIESKSLLSAMERAQMDSLRHPEILYRVMYKKRCRAVYTASDWIYRERILDGWTTYCTFKAGKIGG